MAQITINEISKNYPYSSGNSQFCSVALPMTASWGPAFEDPEALGTSIEEELEATSFLHFAATQQGLEAFNSTFRGPAANYRSAKDFSYQMALTLLTSGYDLDVCRVCSGAHASGRFDATIGTGDSQSSGTLTLRAKYPGSFGNNLIAVFKKVMGRTYWNLITYILDSAGGATPVENLIFVFDVENSNDSIPHVNEVTSSFFDIIVDGIDTDSDVTFAQERVTLEGGSDRKPDDTAEAMMNEAIELATTRFNLASGTDGTDYIAALQAVKASNPSTSKAAAIRYMEWNYNAAFYALDILTDKLSCSAKRLIMPGWDDQNFFFLTGETVKRMSSLSPLHTKMMEVSAASRCMAALLDLPKSLERGGVWVDSPDTTAEGYAQKVSRYTPANDAVNSDGLFSTHFGLYGPWASYKYTGTARNNPAPAAFLFLLMDIAMIRNQSLQYEWIQPSTRVHGLTIGAPDYRVPQKVLEQWQSIDGISLNVLTEIPDQGLVIWGNSTSYDVPVSTYQALQNMSTRFLMNAVRDIVYRCGIAITFQYNNQEAYSQFYAGVTPLLDTMLKAGAITDYEVHMSKDLNAVDSVNLNTVLGKIVLHIQGVINDIIVDLVALPAEA